METEVFTVYDLVAKTSKGVFHAMNVGDAARLFRKNMKDNPDRKDFQLIKLGTYNHETLALEVTDTPEFIDITFTEKEDKPNG